MTGDAALHRVLFVCSRNRWRSPTAEAIFCERDGLSVRSAGFNRDSESPVTEDDIVWADTILVMESRHLKRLKQGFGGALTGKKVASLGIPDKYQYMDRVLVALLRDRVERYL